MIRFKNIKLILYIISLFLLMLYIIPNSVCTASPKEKSSVILIYNNQAKKYYNEKLDAIAIEELNKKIIGIYNIIDNSKYQIKFKEKSYFEDSIETINDLVKDCNAKYVIYTELMPYSDTSNFDLIWHTKKMTATMGLRIIDLHNHSEIFKERYSLEVSDQTDYFFIGNPSMAKKSLKAVLFKVGEAISVYLPL